ncbi:MAG: hypothetical protein FWH32_01040 [Clostridiales bacterium]|nr:hypothetical protein [Clostridiales bacterium]
MAAESCVSGISNEFFRYLICCGSYDLQKKYGKKTRKVLEVIFADELEDGKKTFRDIVKEYVGYIENNNAKELYMLVKEKKFRSLPKELKNLVTYDFKDENDENARKLYEAIDIDSDMNLDVFLDEACVNTKNRCTCKEMISSLKHCHESPNLEKYMRYRLFENFEQLNPKRDYKEGLCRKRFDCDSHDGSCALASKIYDKLWGWMYINSENNESWYNKKHYWSVLNDEEAKSYEIPKECKDLWDFWRRNKLGEYENKHGKLISIMSGLNSDTMNSFKTTYNKALEIKAGEEKIPLESYTVKGGRIDIEKLVLKNPDVLTKICENNDIQKFAQLTHSIGNFTLIPHKIKFGKNKDPECFQYRGSKHDIKDYWDLSLKLLKEPWNFGEGDGKHFEDYIDTFYLNCYVDKNYDVEELFTEHFDVGHLYPADSDEMERFLSNVNEKIISRGTLMVLILMLKKWDELNGKKPSNGDAN